MKLVKIEKNFDIKVSSILESYINPEYVFIPMPHLFNLKVKFKDYIYKEQILLENEEGTPINSPVSGYVVGAKDCVIANGKTMKCVVIENDYKENIKKRTGTKRSINNITKESLIEKLTTLKITSFSNQNEMLYKLFEKKEPVKNIILKVIDDEPYVASESFLLQKFTNEILETLDALTEIFNPDNTYIALKASESENIEILNNLIGTYPKIKMKITPDFYPIGNEYILQKYLFNKKTNYEETIVISATNIYALYNAIKKNRQLTEKLITITGDGITNPKVFNVKIGALVEPLIKENINIKKDIEVEYIVNGLMTGTKVELKDLIVTKHMDSITIKEKLEECTYDCISCGRCFEVCPVKINPKYIMENQDNEVNLLKSKKEKCIACGLCNYVCPSRINLKKQVRGDNVE